MEKTGTSFKCDSGSIFHVHILNSHLALFQTSEIRKEDSKPSHVAWIRKCKGFITKEFDRFGNHSLSLNCKPEIIISAISIKKKKNNDYISRCKHFCSRWSVGTICLNALLILRKKFFENLDKTKNFSKLKVSICLFQREIIYLTTKQDIDLRACFKCKWKFLVYFLHHRYDSF